MADADSSPTTAARRIGPPVLLGLRPRFMDQALAVARRDERIRALCLWGSLARGDADEWSGVDYVVSVSDEAVPQFLDELGREESAYGRSMVTLPMPQHGVDGGGFVSVTYLRSGLPLPVNWFVCPLSLGLPTRDTMPLLSREGWPNAGGSFAELLHDRPSRQSSSPPEWDQVVSMIPIQVKEVARGRPEAVLGDGEPMHDRIDAYAALARHIGALPATYADIRPALYAHLGIARQLGR